MTSGAIHIYGLCQHLFAFAVLHLFEKTMDSPNQYLSDLSPEIIRLHNIIIVYKKTYLFKVRLI